MSLKRDLRCSDLDGRLVFWTGGNKPSQDLYHFSKGAIADSLKANFLLSDHVLASASYYLESPTTRGVVQRLLPLLTQGNVLFFIDEDIESFAEHGARKVEKSPATLAAYAEPEIVARRAAEMSRFGFLLRRPAESISSRIASRWMEDLTSPAIDSLGSALDRLQMDPGSLVSFRIALIDVATVRTTDFVWEVIAPVLETHRAPYSFRRLARERLAAFYGEETAKLLNAAVDASDRRLIAEVKGSADASLFMRFLRVVNAHDPFRRLSAKDCIGLRQSEVWTVFLSFYRQLHEKIGHIEIEELPAFSVMLRAEERWRSGNPQKRGVSRHEFLSAVGHILSGYSRRADRFVKALDSVLEICDSVQSAPISDFISFIEEASARTSRFMHQKRRPKSIGIIVIKPIELDAVKALFRENGTVEEREGILIQRQFYEGTLAGKDNVSLSAVCLRALNKGNPSAQSACQTLLTEYDVRLLVLLGIAGGINPKLNLCDVVVADAVYDYETRAITDTGSKHRLEAYRMSAIISELFSRFMDQWGEEAEFDATAGSPAPTFKTLKGPIGSGEAVVKSELAKVRKWLESINENVMAVETEAVGASYVEHELELYRGPKPIGLLIIRGISDHSDPKKNNSYQGLASAHACIVLDKVLRSYGPTKQWSSN